MKENYDSDHKGANGNTTMQVFRCPVCGGHNLSVIFEIYGMRDIVGVKPDEEVIFGDLDEQGINYGTCSCRDCDWEGEFYRNLEGCFAQHLVETKRLLFTCPQCGAHDLGWLRQGHTTSYPVSAVYEKGTADAIEVAIDKLDRDDNGGRFFYGCGRCQTPLLDENGLPIAKEDDLIAWFKNHQ